MNLNTGSKLENRAIIEVLGADRKKFLQGLITNDVNKATDENLIYACMLNAQGRFLYDFFIFEIGEKLLLDCFAPRRDEIITKLNFYKLRSQVEIKKNDELKIFFSESKTKSETLFFLDPRHHNLGTRIYSADYRLPTTDYRLKYDLRRIFLKVPESELDLTYEKSFILEFGFDALNAVDYNKGCYVGQEPTARAHHLGEIRKKIFHVIIQPSSLGRSSEDLMRDAFRLQTPEILDANASRMTSVGESSMMNGFSIEKNSKLTCEGKDVGQILSSVFFEDELHALALIKPSEVSNFSSIALENHKIFIVD